METKNSTRAPRTKLVYVNGEHVGQMVLSNETGRWNVRKLNGSVGVSLDRAAAESFFLN